VHQPFATIITTALSLALAIFDDLDSSNTGAVDCACITSALSIMCSATLDEKISVAFTLYAKADGALSFDGAVKVS
jgi:Ca2+-binding EF-hand superfamily protein